MISIGNDIVALQYIDEQRTSQPAFYSKFVTAGEQQRQPATLPFAIFAWLLWAVKESAFKYFKRLDPDLIFSPTKFITQGVNQIDTGYSGIISFRDQRLFFLSQVTAYYIAVVVNETDDFSQICWDVEKIAVTDSATQSAEVRRLALEMLSTEFPRASLQIAKSEIGYPVVINDGVKSGVALSFAHHGNYVSYAFATIK